jgi:hypothetical protein
VEVSLEGGHLALRERCGGWTPQAPDQVSG